MDTVQHDCNIHPKVLPLMKVVGTLSQYNILQVPDTVAADQSSTTVLLLTLPLAFLPLPYNI